MPTEQQENSSVMTASNSASGEASVSSSGPQQLLPPPHPMPPPAKKKRNLPGMPDPEAEVIALSPKTLMATNRFVCEICNKGFQRDQNLQLHRRGHNLPWKLRQRTGKEARKRVYVCPEATCVHHDPARALGDLTGIKKHFCRKHGEKKWKCDKCSKKYAVQSDWKAHAKTCGTREYRCDCGTLFSRRDSFITHRAFCDALAEESAKTHPSPPPPPPPPPAPAPEEEAPPLRQVVTPPEQQEPENPPGIFQYMPPPPPPTTIGISAATTSGSNSSGGSGGGGGGAATSTTSLFASLFASVAPPWLRRGAPPRSPTWWAPWAAPSRRPPSASPPIRPPRPQQQPPPPLRCSRIRRRPISAAPSPCILRRRHRRTCRPPPCCRRPPRWAPPRRARPSSAASASPPPYPIPSPSRTNGTTIWITRSLGRCSPRARPRPPLQRRRSGASGADDGPVPAGGAEADDAGSARIGDGTDRRFRRHRRRSLCAHHLNWRRARYGGRRSAALERRRALRWQAVGGRGGAQVQ
uniref:Protein EARLY HEADING DATE 2 n=1 Tax=Ananas comosus var. bracteatus TaxID=296719 RepID=A0A6V7Q3V5_ANACO|nr:unnamed protein product [Ananas comosus var. bracteatus]